MFPPAPAAFGPYRLIEPLARGRTSVTYRASAPGSARPIALKLYSGRLPKPVQEYLETIAGLRHPDALLAPDQAGVIEGRSYAVMREVSGATLAELLAEHSAEGGPRSQHRGGGSAGARLPLGPAIAIARQILGALSLLHRRQDGPRIHGRLSPRKVLIERSSGRALLFGLDRSGAVDLELGYAAPEQVVLAPFDAAADIFAAGAILFELATGRPLVTKGSDEEMRLRTLDLELLSPSRLVPELPARFDAILRTALDPEKRSRFESADALKDALGALAPPGTEDRVPIWWEPTQPTQPTQPIHGEVSLEAFHIPGHSLEGWSWPAAAASPQVPAEPPSPRAPSATLLISRPAPVRLRPAWAALVIGASFIAVTGLLAGLYALASAPVSPVESPAKSALPARQAPPSVTAHRALEDPGRMPEPEDQVPVPEPEPGPESEPTPAPSPTKRSTRATPPPSRARSSATKAAPTVLEPAKPPVEAATPAESLDAVRRLIARARALKAQKPEVADKADRLLSRLVLEASAGDRRHQAARIAALAAEIDELERGAHRAQ